MSPQGHWNRTCDAQWWPRCYRLFRDGGTTAQHVAIVALPQPVRSPLPLSCPSTSGPSAAAAQCVCSRVPPVARALASPTSCRVCAVRPVLVSRARPWPSTRGSCPSLPRLHRGPPSRIASIIVCTASFVDRSMYRCSCAPIVTMWRKCVHTSWVRAASARLCGDKQWTDTKPVHNLVGACANRLVHHDVRGVTDQPVCPKRRRRGRVDSEAAQSAPHVQGAGRGCLDPCAHTKDTTNTSRTCHDAARRNCAYMRIGINLPGGWSRPPVGRPIQTAGKRESHPLSASSRSRCVSEGDS